ncbi:MAG: hypothetical protein DBY24_06200 [Prevotellaceae bacterium]|nr:MAG: hypothetical protein DBY24_06200 [Prevotellaceae bacterium]
MPHDVIYCKIAHFINVARTRSIIFLRSKNVKTMISPRKSTFSINFSPKIAFGQSYLPSVICNIAQK